MKRHTPKLSLGFTLIELLTVIAIVAILAAILIPVVGKMLYNARQAHGISNLRNIASAVHLYVSEHNGDMPPPKIDDKDWNEWYPDNKVSSDQPWQKLVRDYLPQKAGHLTAPANEAFICRNVDYTDSGGNLIDIDKLSLTYSGTGAFWHYGSDGRRTEDYHSRNINTIFMPNKTLLVVDAKQYAGLPYCPSTLVESHVRKDTAVGTPEETSYMDFRQPGQTMNVLYVDGHTGTLTLADVKALKERDWTGRDN